MKDYSSSCTPIKQTESAVILLDRTLGSVLFISAQCCCTTGMLIFLLYRRFSCTATGFHLVFRAMPSAKVGDLKLLGKPQTKTNAF